MRNSAASATVENTDIIETHLHFSLFEGTQIHLSFDCSINLFLPISKAEETILKLQNAIREAKLLSGEGVKQE